LTDFIQCYALQEVDIPAYTIWSSFHW